MTTASDHQETFLGVDEKGLLVLHDVGADFPIDLLDELGLRLEGEGAGHLPAHLDPWHQLGARGYVVQVRSGQSLHNRGRGGQISGGTRQTVLNTSSL